MCKINNICVLSSQLFLLSSIFNYYNNYFYSSYSIFILYCSSVLYHSTNNILVKKIDMFITKIAICLCIIISINEKNIYPSLCTSIVIMCYNPKKSHLYHSLLVHIPGFIGFMSLSY
jgi:hypothetical protein